MKTSFFKDYILYRIKGLLGYFITSCVLCLISGPMTLTITWILTSIEERLDYKFGGYLSFYGIVLSLYAAVICIPALILLAAIMPVATRRHLNRRNCVDTFGALPLTYKQRYWGDLLAEIAAYVTPIIPAGIFTCVITAILTSIDQYQELDSLLAVVFSIFLTLLICVVAAIALSGFMAQCCGKAGSGELYTFIVGLVIPLLVVEYTNIIEINALGIENFSMGIPACLAIPPFGTLITAWQSVVEGNSVLDESLALNSPITLIVMLVITAAWIIGGYYLGKKRKAELVGESVLFKPVSIIVSIVAALGILGIFSASLLFERDYISTIIIIVAAFIIFMVFELITKRRSIKVLRSIIIYVCSAVVVVGYTALMHFTDAFGLGDYIPSVNSVREITIDNRMDFNDELVFNDKKAIQIIIDHHKKLLDSKEKMSTGSEFEISYKLKNGTTVTRSYSSDDDTFFDELLGEALKLPQSGTNRYTVLAKEDIKLYMRLVYSSSFTDDEGYYSRAIKPEKTDELRRLLYEDINDNYYQFIDNNFENEKDVFGEINVDYSENGHNLEPPYIGSMRYIYVIPFTYKRTVDFLSDPANLVTSAENSEFSINGEFRIRYDYDGVKVFVNYPDKDKNPIPEELFNMLTPKEEGVEYSERFEISFFNEESDGDLFIRKSDEKRAAEILFKALESYKSEDTEFYSTANTRF